MASSPDARNKKINRDFFSTPLKMYKVGTEDRQPASSLAIKNIWDRQPHSNIRIRMRDHIGKGNSKEQLERSPDVMRDILSEQALYGQVTLASKTEDRRKHMDSLITPDPILAK